MRLPSPSQLHKIRQTRLQLAILNPLFPASGLATGSFNGLHPESKFLADKADGVVEFGGIVHRERVSLKKVRNGRELILCYGKKNRVSEKIPNVIAGKWRAIIS